MKRGTPMKRSGFLGRRTPRISESVLAQNPSASSEKPIRELQPATRTATYAGATTGPKKKEPHTVNPHLRNLARGEICTGLRYGGYCHCDPATTVWAHTNTQADQKGLGYKGHDHMGAFLGYDCHAWIDQGAGSAEERAAFMAAAQERTRDRLREIAASPAVKPWRREAARWALEQISISPINEKN